MEELPEIQLGKHTDLNMGVMTFEELFQAFREAESHDPFAPHKIKFNLILLVTKNAYSHFIDFKSHELKEGSSLFVSRNQVHYFNDGLLKAKGYAVFFNHLFVDKHYFLNDNLRLNRLFNYHIESPVIHQKEMGQDNLVPLIAELHKEYGSENKFVKSEMLASLLRLILLKAERAKELHAFSNVSAYWLETFSNFRDLLEIEYVNTRNSKFYASELIVSYKLLNDIVKKMTGKTVKAFIDAFVTTEIKRYLISTALSVNEISYKTGFEDPTNMVKFFKKNTDVTPFKFRQQAAN